MHSKQTRRATRQRRAVSTLWVILLMPVLALLICLVVDVANLWLARVELESTVEATALAGAIDWGRKGGGANTLASRERARAIFESNQIRAVSNTIGLNHSFGGDANQNDQCPSGDLVFGSINRATTPYTFNANVVGGCVPVTICFDAFKNTSGGVSSAPRLFGIFYKQGPAPLYITSVAFTIPEFNVNANQQPYFDSAPNAPRVSITSASDFLNDNNATPVPTGLPAPNDETTDIRGMAYGDVSFSFSNQVIAPDRWRTVTANFTPGTFTSTMGPPANPDFVRFGVDLNGLRPPALNPPPAGNNNDGDAVGIARVQVTVTLSNGITSTALSTVFTDDGVNNDQSFTEINASQGGAPAVRAQTTIPVKSLCAMLFGQAQGPLNVTARATALYDCNTGRASLVRVIEPINCGP